MSEANDPTVEERAAGSPPPSPDVQERIRRWWDGFERDRPGYLTGAYSNDLITVYRLANDPSDYRGSRS